MSYNLNHLLPFKTLIMQIAINARLIVFCARCASSALDAQDMRKEIACARYQQDRTVLWLMRKILLSLSDFTFSVLNGYSMQRMRKIDQRIALIFQLDYQDLSLLLFFVKVQDLTSLIKV